MNKAGDQVIYYAVDRSELHLALLKLSLKSLRLQNTKIPVVVCIFGEISKRHRREIEKCCVSVIDVSRTQTELKLPPTFLKWLALSKINAKRLLYLDVDTWCFKDPAILFNKFTSKDFWAREEFGTNPNSGHQMLGNCVLEIQVHPKKWKAISQYFSFRPGTIFNTGVMLFNNNSHAQVIHSFDYMTETFLFFKEKPAFFPAENFHIAEEIISSMVLGHMKGIKTGRISKEISPWYCEWKAGVVNSHGVVMHSWTKYSPFFVRDFAGKKAAQKIPFLLPVKSEYSEI